MVLAVGALPVSAQVSLVGAGTGCAVTDATCAPAVNASSTQNDILVAVLHSRTNTAHTCQANCTGWTEFSTQAGDAIGGRLSVWWLRVGASLPPSPTFDGPATESFAGRIWTFRGAITSVNPWDVLGPNTTQASAATFTGTNLTSTVNNVMVVFAAGSMDRNSWGTTSGGCDTPTAANAAYYVSNNNGTANSVAICIDSTPTNSPGLLGAPSYTMTARGPDPGRWFTFALKPQPAAANTTVGNFVSAEAGSATLAPGAALTDLDAFSLVTSTGTDTVTAATVTLAPAGAFNNIATVALTSDNGATTYGSVAPTSNAVGFTGLSIPVTTTAVQFKVRVQPKAHGTMPAVPGASYATTGTVTAITGTNAPVYNDSGSGTLTIDNLSPGNATWGTVTPGDTQVVLNWSNPADADFSQVVILRSGATISDVPVEG
ncbi:MAG: hypothetical protein HY909_06330, partial [Deltaproteobacteria bacterium]|nr:hypothetical protein [Deltaproteobacteria bacterium]